MTHRCLLALCLASFPVLAQAAGASPSEVSGPDAAGTPAMVTEAAAEAGPAAVPAPVALEAAEEEGATELAAASPAGGGSTGDGQATPGAAPDAPAAGARGPDPWEGFNRSIFRFNDRVDRYALKPVAKGYQKITPRPVRTGVTNFFRNLKMPVVMLNDLLQGKALAAGQDLSRFVVNTTVGIAGVFDPSTRFGIPRNDEDFGQTLGKWGVPPGPYLVLPFLGPSSVRDGGGFGVDVVTDPITFEFEEGVSFGLWTVKLVNTRANLLEVEEIIQGDRYLFLRDLYLQSREFAVKDGKVESDPFLDEEDPATDDDSGASDDSGAGEAAPGPDGGAAPPAGKDAPGDGDPDAGAGADSVQDSTAPSVGATPADE